MQDANLQIATEGDVVRVRFGQGLHAEPLQQVQPQGLHAATTVRLPDRPGAPEKELSRHRDAAAGQRLLVQADRHEESS